MWKCLLGVTSTANLRTVLYYAWLAAGIGMYRFQLRLLQTVESHRLSGRLFRQEAMLQWLPEPPSQYLWATCHSFFLSNMRWRQERVDDPLQNSFQCLSEHFLMKLPGLLVLLMVPRKKISSVFLETVACLHSFCECLNLLSQSCWAKLLFA